MKIALAQVNQIFGKIEENRDKILNLAHKAKDKDVELIIFPEFSVVGGYGYDLFNNKDFILASYKAMEVITSQTPIHTICGVITNDKFNQNLINAVALFHNDNMTTVAAKDILDDAEFNDRKYFKSSGFSNVFKINDKNIACVIADSIDSMKKNIEKAAWLGIDMVVLLSCSTYYKGKPSEIKNILKQSAKDNAVDIAYVNMVGAQDGYVFDGGSLYVCKDGNFKAVASNFKEDLLIFDTESDNVLENDISQEKEMYDALVLGLKDYCNKNGFKKCALGISGGIDSALTLAIAVDALGKDNILGVLMPSQHTSKESNLYAEEICQRLQVENKTLALAEIYDAYMKTLSFHFEGQEKDLTEENLQARIRCNFLMSLSNKFGYLILCTCNKSEDAVGYSTLYGDAIGGYSVIGDLFKKEVYQLSKYRNTISDVIPRSIIDRVPTAELRENQKDSDFLPEYDVLDDVLEKILDKRMAYQDVVDSGISKNVVDKVLKLLFSSEYKRRQSPIGTRVSKTAFSRDVLLPMSNGYICETMSNGYIWKPVIEKNIISDIEKD
ncbi:MAG: NAD+ synthase [Endomicrobiaceae bacterium]|nr:NAD+ synthase [Endomicrobiaceae bacterium]